MTSTKSSGCPDESVLRRLWFSEHADGSNESTSDPVIQHVETCVLCQELLEELAARDRHVFHDLLTSASIRSDQPVVCLPDFRIVRQLGRGMTSRVYLAEELSTSRLVALKLIPIARDNTAAQRSQWLSEVRAAASVEHQHVVRLYRVEEADEHFLFVFEYIAGGTLRDWIEQPASQLQIARVAELVARAVHYIHQKNILHLDLKPSNILIDVSDGPTWDTLIPRVSDFGIATGPHVQPEGPQAVLVRGTPAYMAPEQLLGDTGLLSPATDVYGLGGILYCMLTGRPPRSERSDLQTAEQLLSEPITAPVDLDQTIDCDLSAIVMRCLEKQPQHRYSTPLDVALALQSWIRQHTNGTHPSVTSSAPARRAMIWSLVVVLATGMLWFVVQSRFSSREDIDRGSLWTRDVVSIAPEKASSSSLPEAVRQLLEQTPLITPGRQDVESLIQELSDEPPAFTLDRAARLVVSNRRYTDHLLRQNPVPMDECLRFGTLQKAAGIRFDLSGTSELYSMTRFLAEDSIRLLEAVVQHRPGDQVALENLIASRSLLALIRIDKGQHSVDAVQRHIREVTSKLRPVVPLITRLTDQRQRIYWAGVVLDTYRGQAWNSQLSGDSESASVYASWENEAWQILKADHSVADLRYRHSLLRFDVDAPDWGALNGTPWVLEENRQRLLLDSAALFLTFHFFDAARTAAVVTGDSRETERPTPSVWDTIVSQTEYYLDRRGLNEVVPPQLVHEDLIRPLTTFCTRFRSDGRLQDAEHLQRCYFQLCTAVHQRYPDNADIHLALSEAHLQAWKNALRRELPAMALMSLRESLREAQMATELSPTSTRARDQVADRVKRIARFEASSSQASRPVPVKNSESM